MSTGDLANPTLAQRVDHVPRAAYALAAATVTADWEQARHAHEKGQLLYAVRGLLRCEAEGGVWMVPPQGALWIPGGTPHAVRGAGEAHCLCVFVDPSAGGLPETVCTLAVSPLLRELLLRAAALPELYPLGGREERLIATLLDELAMAPVEALYLPLPRDARLRILTEHLLTDPLDRTTSRHWATRLGMSERSLSRLLAAELGMSLGQWRRQLHVILALQRLTRGDSVQTVAIDLGYENASGFVTMFRKATGKPPGRYLADRSAPPEPDVPTIPLL